MTDKMTQYIETNNICYSIGEAKDLLLRTINMDKEDFDRVWEITEELGGLFTKYDNRRKELRKEIEDMLDKVEQ